MTTITLEGTLQADGVTLQLEKKVALPPGRVTVTVQSTPVQTATGPTMVEVLDRIHRNQQHRGREPMTEEDMVAEIAQLRDDDEYEARCQKIWAQSGTEGREGE